MSDTVVRMGGADWVWVRRQAEAGCWKGGPSDGAVFLLSTAYGQRVVERCAAQDGRAGMNRSG